MGPDHMTHKTHVIHMTHMTHMTLAMHFDFTDWLQFSFWIEDGLGRGFRLAKDCSVWIAGRVTASHYSTASTTGPTLTRIVVPPATHTHLTPPPDMHTYKHTCW